VVTSEDNTAVTIIEPYFLNVFLQHYPEIVLKHVFVDLATALYAEVKEGIDFLEM